MIKKLYFCSCTPLSLIIGVLGKTCVCMCMEGDRNLNKLNKGKTIRGVARNFLEGSSKSSKMLVTMVGKRRKFGVVEQLQR